MLPLANFLPSGKERLVFLIFLVLSLVGISHHELWLDEAQQYLLSRDSNTFSEMVFACRNEGHPLLRNSLLFFITRFSNNIFYMQLLHVCISCIMVLVLLKSNLSFIEKVLIIFGYYIFFEYNLISKNYNMSALLILLLVQEYSKNRAAILRLSVIIFFLANTHLFSLLVSFAFVFTYLFYNRDLLTLNNKKVIAALLILLSGWAIAVYCIIPTSGYGQTFLHYENSGYFSNQRILKTISVCLKGIFYVPDYSTAAYHFEDTLYYQSLHLRTWMEYILAFAAIITPFFILKKNRFMLLLFYSFLLVFIPVYYFLPLVNGSRYYGFFFVMFLACYIAARPLLSGRVIKLCFCIFFLHFINGVYAFSMDACYPFSESKNASEYLAQVRHSDEKVFILNPVLRPGICAYTGEKFWGVENGKPMSYCLWETRLPVADLKSKLKEAMSSDSTCIVIDNKPFQGLIDSSKTELLHSFNSAILNGENFTVYRYRK